MCIARLQSPYTLTLRESISMSIYTHKHHIIPRHMGGTDDPSNLVVLSIEDHAQAHLDLYEQHGLMQDLVAHRMLLGQIDKAEAIKLLQKAPKSERWKQTMRERNTGEGNPMYGKTIMDEHKEAIRVANSVPKPHVSKNMKRLHEEGKTYKFSKKDCGARPVIADGVRYESLSDACKAFGFKSHNSGAYKIKSLKWDWNYEE